VTTRLTLRVVPSLLVRDLPRTLAFYARLGFRPTGTWPDAERPTWAEVTRDAVALQFHTEPPRGTPPRPVCSGTFYLHPESVQALADELRDAVPFEWGPEVMDYGMRDFTVRDPDGYLLAFPEPARGETTS